MIVESSSFKKRILLVDDDYSVTKMLSLLLQTRGYKVSIADNGESALKEAGNSFDLILLDLGLPDQQGLEVCQKFRQQQTSRNIPIIILSGNILSKDIIESLYLGADDYLTKPFDYEELVARMEAVMRRGSFADIGKDRNNDAAIFAEMKAIIEQEKIMPVFQPLYHFKERALLGVEALMRPQTDCLLSNPDLLVKTAIKFGFYQELELVAMKLAIRHLSGKLNDKKLFLNCNPYLVEGKNFSTVIKLLEDGNVCKSNVVLEITERSAISDFKTFYEHLRLFRDCGVQFAIDDVGGGYASLESIVETKPEVVKIDRHIINQISTDAYKRSIVKFIVSFCKENHILSVAEGIETQEDLKAVMDLGVDAGQGYYLCKPQSDPDIKKLESQILF